MLLCYQSLIYLNAVSKKITFGLQVRNDTENLEKRLDEALELVGLIPKSFLHRAWHELKR